MKPKCMGQPAPTTACPTFSLQNDAPLPSAVLAIIGILRAGLGGPEVYFKQIITVHVTLDETQNLSGPYFTHI